MSTPQYTAREDALKAIAESTRAALAPSLRAVPPLDYLAMSTSDGHAWLLKLILAAFESGVQAGLQAPAIMALPARASSVKTPGK